MVIARQQKLAILFIHPPTISSPPPQEFLFLIWKQNFIKDWKLQLPFSLVYLIISPHVQQNREALMGLYPGQRCVQGEFPHGDPHSIAAQVSQSQNPLSICHHDRLIKHILWFIWLTLYRELSWIISLYVRVNQWICFAFSLICYIMKRKLKQENYKNKVPLRTWLDNNYQSVKILIVFFYMYQIYNLS